MTQINGRDALGRQVCAEFLVQKDIGAAKSVDRLLGISDQKQLPGLRPHRPPFALTGIIGRQENENLGLHRIGILELIHEYMAEAILEQAANIGIVADQISSSNQQVHKVDFSRPNLQVLVNLDQVLHFRMQQRGQIRIRTFNEKIQRIDRPLDSLQDLIARELAGEFPRTRTLPGPFAELTGQPNQQRLQFVRVAPADLFASLKPGHEIDDALQTLADGMPGHITRRCDFRQNR